MRTARSGGCTCPRGVNLPGGVTAGGYLPGGVPTRGCTCTGGCTFPEGCTCLGVYLMGVYLPGGVPARGCTCPGGYLPRGCTCPGGYLPRYFPPMNRLTDRCKNITLNQTSFAAGNKGKSAVWIFSVHWRMAMIFTAFPTGRDFIVFVAWNLWITNWQKC